VFAVFEYGVAKMEVKEIANFIAKPKYVYGPLGVPHNGPEEDCTKTAYLCEPNTTCFVTIELIRFVNNSLGESLGRMKPEEVTEIPFSQVIQAATQLKEDGNAKMKKRRFYKALKSYSKAAKILDQAMTVNKVEDTQRNNLLFILFLNMAQCNLDMEDWNEALRQVKKATRLPNETEGKRCKLNYRAAIAYFNLGKTDLAKEKIQLALEFAPGNKEVHAYYQKILKHLEEEKQFSNDMYKKMSGGL